MDTAVMYTELMDKFKNALSSKGTVEVLPGRRFDRVVFDESVMYFVERHNWTIYGAKSSFQFNPRREHGTLNTVDQYDWTTGLPIAGTEAEKIWNEREAEIQKNYKPRGRPRKNPKP